MLRKQMQARCPGSRFVGPACLRGHRLDFTRLSPRWGGGVADVMAAVECETWGGLFEVTMTDLDALDIVEGHPLAYERRIVVVETVAGEQIDAWAYVVVDKVSTVLPSREYWEVIVGGAVECGLPCEYLSMLRALSYSSD